MDAANITYSTYTRLLREQCILTNLINNNFTEWLKLTLSNNHLLIQANDYHITTKVLIRERIKQLNEDKKEIASYKDIYNAYSRINEVNTILRKFHASL